MNTEKYNFYEALSFPDGACFKTDFLEYQDFIWVACDSTMIAYLKNGGDIVLSHVISGEDSARYLPLGKCNPFFIESNEKIDFVLKKNFVPLENKPDGWYKLENGNIGYKKDSSFIIIEEDRVLSTNITGIVGTRMNDDFVYNSYIYDLCGIENTPKQVPFVVHGTGQNIKYFFFVNYDIVFVVKENGNEIMRYGNFVALIRANGGYHFTVDPTLPTNIVLT